MRISDWSSDVCSSDLATHDPEGCPAFYGRTISGVTNGSAPEWMRRRLEAIGQRSISALVDISNYVMFDLGRPSHIYDRSEEHTSELQSLMRISYAVFCLKKKNNN